jgi:serine protease Do
MRLLHSRLLLGVLFSLGLSLLLAGQHLADEPKRDDAPPPPPLPPVFSRPQPESIDDLKAIEKQVETILPKITPAVVGVSFGAKQGSGVIVSKDGKVLTAGHVSGAPGGQAQVIFPDGKRVKAKALGQNKGIDSGMLQITEPGEYPYVDLGKSSGLKWGQWVLALGHPGGFKANRTPVVRVGRVLFASDYFIRTDCTLVGGDSGGPLFDMNGRVIGIHSRIGGTISENMHVPVDTFRQTWERLAKGESWGVNLGEMALVKSAGGKIVYEKSGKLSPEDPKDTKRTECLAQMHTFKMTPGATYTIDLISNNSKKLDPYLRLEDSKGKQLAEDDDGAGNQNSRIVFRPSRVDEYRIIVTSCDPGQTGGYKLVIREAAMELHAGKVDLLPAVRLNKQVLPVLLDQLAKEGVALYASALLFDAKGNLVADKGVLPFLWEKGQADVTGKDGVFRLKLSKQNVRNLMVQVPDGGKIALELTDAAGNAFAMSPEFANPKTKSAGGKQVLAEFGTLTDKDAVDSVRDKKCVYKAHTFKMLAGATYTIDLESYDFDAYLRLEDPSGKQLAEDDDSGGKLNSRIVFTPETDGIYRLIVTTCDPGQAGGYRLLIHQAETRKVENSKGAGDSTGDAPPR